MKLLFFLTITVFFSTLANAQNNDAVNTVYSFVGSKKDINNKNDFPGKKISPFNTNLYRDGGIILGAVGINQQNLPQKPKAAFPFSIEAVPVIFHPRPTKTVIFYLMALMRFR